MINAIRNFFGSEKTDFAQLVKGGAIILDVRTKGEFAGGHIQGSINISVDQLTGNLHKLKDKGQPIITCCASGGRSATAKNILLANGFTNVYDGGGWRSLQNNI